MSKSTRRADAKLNKTDRRFPQEYPSPEEIAEQKRIQAEIDEEKLAAGPRECLGRRGQVNLKMHETRHIPAIKPHRPKA